MQDRLEIEVHRVNERFFELLTDSAQHDTQPVFSLVNTIRRELGIRDCEMQKVAGLEDLDVRVDVAWARAP